jgi:hypothetical protein
VYGDEVLVAERTVEVRCTIVDLYDRAQARTPLPDRGDSLGELPVEQQHLGVGVVEEVGELVVEIAVVDVHMDRARLERGELGLEVLVRVVEVEADLGVGSDAELGKRRGQASRALVELPPRDPPLALDERGAVGRDVGDRFPDIGQVPLHGPGA